MVQRYAVCIFKQRQQAQSSGRVHVNKEMNRCSVSLDVNFLANCVCLSSFIPLSNTSLTKSLETSVIYVCRIV